MKQIDILSALNTPPPRGKGRCGVASFLDSIPEGTPMREELIRLVETVHDRLGEQETRSAQDMAIVLTSLGYTVTQNPIHDHRNHACRCYR